MRKYHKVVNYPTGVAKIDRFKPKHCRIYKKFTNQDGYFEAAAEYDKNGRILHTGACIKIRRSDHTRAERTIPA